MEAFATKRPAPQSLCADCEQKLTTLATQHSLGLLMARRLGQLKDAGEMNFAQVSMAKRNNVRVALEGARLRGYAFCPETMAEIARALGVPFRDCSDVLFCDTALAVQVPYETPDAAMASHTISTAQKAGWTWDIGLPARRGIGYPAPHYELATYYEEARAAEGLYGAGAVPPGVWSVTEIDAGPNFTAALAVEGPLPAIIVHDVGQPRMESLWSMVCSPRPVWKWLSYPANKGEHYTLCPRQLTSQKIHTTGHPDQFASRSSARPWRPQYGPQPVSYRINWITPPGGINRGLHISDFGHGGIKKEGV
jgi:hypothetical protein